MTSGVSRSRSLPFSASAGDTKTSAIKAMLQTHSRGCGNGATRHTNESFDIRDFMLRISAAPKAVAYPTSDRGHLARTSGELAGHPPGVQKSGLLATGMW